VGDYWLDEVGEWDVELPVSAPCAEGARHRCRLKEHSRRQRETGPAPDLVVVRCKTHGCFFTIYPPGYVPYGRQRLPTAVTEVTTAPAVQAAGAAADSAVQRWPDWADPDGVEPAWASTQWRQLKRWGQWLGLSGEEATGQRIATTLELDLHEHVSARAQYQRGGYRRRGRAILGVLRAVGRLGNVLERLLRAGHLAGLVGRAFLVPRRGRLRPLVPV